MNLYIIRHAIAVDSGTPGYEEDSQRPLTEKGRARMTNIARGLKALDIKPDLIITSPYLRAVETSQILLKHFKMKKKQLAVSENLTPMALPAQLLGEINENYSTFGNIAIVGHEPNLSGTISMLLTGNALLSIEMKKGGVCCLYADDLLQEHRATLEWMMMPKHLIALGDIE